MLRRSIGPLMLLAVLLAGCGTASSGGPAGPSGSPTGAAAATGSAEPVFAFSEAVAGKNRIAIGLIRQNTPLNEPAAKVHLRFFDLDENNAQIKFESDATYFGQGLPAAFYVAYPSFDKAGNWGVEIQVQLPGQDKPSVSRQRLEVKESSAVPNIGQPAIAAKTPTVKDVPDVAQLSSGPSPDPAMYQVSLDQALQSGKPTALLFATPAFCKTATCGPSLQVMQGLQKQYGDKVNFIHVEVYKYPFDDSLNQQEQAVAKALAEKRDLTPEEAATGLADAMVAWHLTSEPWLFLIDAKGSVASRYEGGITKEEIGPALEKLIAGQPVF
ncbi:MAG: thioredoxin family protein [Kouleothrix sp.]|nr:thioredoxin family protein [Kouleothrix sp.]